MKRFLINCAYVLATLVGIGLLVYPHVNFWVNNRSQADVLQNYSATLGQLDEATIQAELENAREYNKRLNGETIEDPFIPGSGMVMPENYAQQLSAGSVETMARVKIPKIGIDLPVYHGTSTGTLLKGIGHLEGSSLPVGGEGTHTVITGHTGLSTAKMFTDLVELEQGDEFYLYVLNEVLAYKVDQIKVVDPQHTEDLHTIAGEDYATLLTCTPYGVNSHRLLVRGTRVPYTPQQIEERISETKSTTSRETLMLFVSVGALLFLLVLILVSSARARKKALKKAARPQPSKRLRPRPLPLKNEGS